MTKPFNQFSVLWSSSFSLIAGFGGNFSVHRVHGRGVHRGLDLTSIGVNGRSQLNPLPHRRPEVLGGFPDAPECPNREHPGRVPAGCVGQEDAHLFLRTSLHHRWIYNIKLCGIQKKYNIDANLFIIISLECMNKGEIYCIINGYINIFYHRMMKFEYILLAILDYIKIYYIRFNINTF